MSASKTILVTGFDPFGGDERNASWEAVRLLPGQIGSCALHKLEIPTVFGRGAERVLEAAKTLAPDVILCVGQAALRTAVTPELIGINYRDARIPDNGGNQPRGEAVVPGGPDGLFSTLPVQAMAEAMTAAGHPAQLSLSAGAYVCNDTLYTLLHHFRGSPVRVGFVHIPPVEVMESERAAQALTAAIAVLDGE